MRRERWTIRTRRISSTEVIRQETGGDFVIQKANREIPARFLSAVDG